MDAIRERSDKIIFTCKNSNKDSPFYAQCMISNQVKTDSSDIERTYKTAFTVPVCADQENSFSEDSYKVFLVINVFH